jgi:hypothetical protein
MTERIAETSPRFKAKLADLNHWHKEKYERSGNTGTE